MDMNQWKRIRLSKDGPLLSYPFLIDNLLIFVEIFMDKFEIIQGVVDKFCFCPSQKVNEKTEIFFSLKN